MTRIVLTTGGTGGHIFPALAVAEAVRGLEPAAKLLFVGGGGPEGELATKAGIPFVGLPAKGVFGRGLRALAAPFWMARAFGQAVRVLQKARPDVVDRLWRLCRIYSGGGGPAAGHSHCHPRAK